MERIKLRPQLNEVNTWTVDQFVSYCSKHPAKTSAVCARISR